MPYYRSRSGRIRRRPARRYVRRSYAGRYRRRAVAGRRLGFPAQRSAMLRYCTHVTLSNGAGPADAHAFLLNSIYDPDATGTGHQPMGHDTWANIYNHYVVNGARVRLQFSSTGDDTSRTPIMIGAYVSDDGTYPSDWTVLRESGTGTSTAIVNHMMTKTLGLTYSTKKFFNVVDVKDNFDRLGAPFGSNPTEGANLVIWAESQDQTSLLPQVHVAVTIDYYVSFSEPLDQAQN